MLTEDELKRIYLNYKIKQIIPFLKKFTQKNKKEAAVILNKDRGYNQASMLAILASSRTQDQYKKLLPGYYTIPTNFLSELLLINDVPRYTE
ncbi:hypothetical protein BN1195_02729 [Chryseobacterium oranimense G311]|uniref:hypothetical protein n=1 Tax=Chryseobacterium oranimense TaxID=421058 RepID=UPI0005337BE2|nr:hypothetical protein [Chryseobacterium oranimense]CEJ70419.1 hypothetical protein BN1195_02729 [Chryseobacterium oranimense G311]